MTLFVSVVSAVIAGLSAAFAFVQAAGTRKQVREAAEQRAIAERQLALTVAAAEKSARQAEHYAGAQSAISWRDQVFALHDRGLAPGQIRYLMHLESGGAGYEGWNGRIENLVGGLSPSTDPSRHTVPSCTEMPLTRDGCTGPCRAALQQSGTNQFRASDIGSPNETAGGREASGS
ncbi:MAG TPA: hypothetical protein VES42_15320 [Pilimelia sp.]|nr:hypothetical protein [Pilimelia sp.]